MRGLSTPVRRAGYNMTEMMVVIAIIGVMVGVGVSSFSKFGKGNRLNKGATLVRTVFQAAKQSAITYSSDRRVAVDLRNDKLWIEKKILLNLKWDGNSEIVSKIVEVPEFVNLSDVNCKYGLLHGDDLSQFPADKPAIFYAVFTPRSTVSSVHTTANIPSVNEDDEFDYKNSFSLHISTTNTTFELASGRAQYDLATIKSGVLKSVKGSIRTDATAQEAHEYGIRNKVYTVTVNANTGMVKFYNYGKNKPFSDNKPKGVFR
jgi:prepilin-type N-terminal cleavage/methylation domain-containing protein